MEITQYYNNTWEMGHKCQTIIHSIKGFRSQFGGDDLRMTFNFPILFF